uniref:Alkylglycerone-phosphate synthase n=1 Tax=Suberites domuncula TaxID=55567 RepID=Q70SU0_SUBDO|nr:alkyl-dihydroxyacetonephosphate synthase [Suberites domuncula]CAD79441.1 dihydroxyacetonephosphate synthase [Suberites domuncula]
MDSTEGTRGSNAARRLAVLKGHLNSKQVQHSPCNSMQSSAPMSSSKDEVQRAFPRERQEVLKWNGWGYKDSGFLINDKGMAQFLGKRYAIGGQELPHFRKWMEENVQLDLSQTSFSQPRPPPEEIPAPIQPSQAFIDEIAHHCKVFTDSADERIFRSHGHTCHELFSLRTGKVGRIPDLVVWPRSHQDVEVIVKAALRHDMCIIPFGGGTNVSGALLCPPEEERPIVSLDMTEMDRILWIDEENLTACIEGGCVGQDLERKLGEMGYTTGHEPDSLEFSTVGGWVATRSSGMKKDVYGNIEDLVVRVRMVTPRGTVERSILGPRNSVGPDVQQFVIGSEGILGVITEVTMRIRPLPEVRRYGSVVFPSFQPGVEFMREVARQRCAPASIRLMDNWQFQMGQAMKPAASVFKSFTDALKKLYVTKFKGFDPYEMVACTLLFEGAAEEVAIQERRIYEIAAKFGGIPAGEENGRRGYLFTFVIAYIRDLGFDYSYLAESFETSVPWSRVSELVRNVKDRVRRECLKHGIGNQPLISARVTQTYDAGACIYFYLVFNYVGNNDPITAFDEVETAARGEILACGGSLSHHHGVVKIRKRWVEQTLSRTGVEMLRAIKDRIDPHNIFGAGNLIPN